MPLGIDIAFKSALAPELQLNFVLDVCRTCWMSAVKTVANGREPNGGSWFVMKHCLQIWAALFIPHWNFSNEGL